MQIQLPEKWQEHWQAARFTAPSLIQEQVYQPLTDGQHLVGISPTGSGKTLAYLWPLLQKVEKDGGNQLLILTSSQELAMQVTNVAREWAKDLELKVQSLIGGASVKRQIEKLKERPEVLIGTPGRVLELIKSKKLKAHQIKMLVFDEADQLLQGESKKMLETILHSTMKDTQRAYFSATADQVLAEIQALEEDLLVIDVTKEDQSQGVIRHIYLDVPQRKKIDTLRSLCHVKGFEGLVFFNQVSDLGAAEQKLLYHDLPVASLASDQSKTMRKLALSQFREHQVPVLLTTDVTARGLDVPDLPYVVNIEVPLTKESYLHRAGRVGRMGADGIVLTLVAPEEGKAYQKILRANGLSSSRIYLHGGQLLAEEPEKITEPKRKKHKKKEKKSPKKDRRR